MIIKGNQRGGAKSLAKHLLSSLHNEAVIVEVIRGFWYEKTNPGNFQNALWQMDQLARISGEKRALYHLIVAPQAGEVLGKTRLLNTIEAISDKLDLDGYQYIAIRHIKNGREHFHIVFNLIHPNTGILKPIADAKRKEWQTARALEKSFGLKPIFCQGRSIRRWEYERSKRSGIDPLAMRKTVTEIYQNSISGTEFIKKLHAAGLILTRGRYCLVLVDRAGDIHGLIRRIEGGRLAFFQKKFPELATARLPSAIDIQKKMRPSSYNCADLLRRAKIRRRAVRHLESELPNPSFLCVINKKGHPPSEESRMGILLRKYKAAHKIETIKRLFYTSLLMTRRSPMRRHMNDTEIKSVFFTNRRRRIGVRPTPP